MKWPQVDTKQRLEECEMDLTVADTLYADARAMVAELDACRVDLKRRQQRVIESHHQMFWSLVGISATASFVSALLFLQEWRRR